MQTDYAQLRESLKTVAFTNPTPFTEDKESIVHPELHANIEFVYDRGGRLFIPCGNTGEYYSLTDEERIAVVETTVKAAGEDATVIGGAGGSLKQVMALTDAYEDAGADAVILMDPSHTYIHECGLIDYYREIIEHTSLGVVIYKRSETITTDVINDLADYENVIAVKFAVNDVKGFSRAVDTVDGEIVWTDGLAERFAPSFAIEGAEGVTTGIGNFAPEACLELMDALHEGEYKRAERISTQFRNFEDLREEPGERNRLSAANNVPAVKYGLELAGQYGGPVRKPIVDLSEEDMRRAEQYYDEVKSITKSTAQ